MAEQDRIELKSYIDDNLKKESDPEEVLAQNSAMALLGDLVSDYVYETCIEGKLTAFQAWENLELTYGVPSLGQEIEL